jgi:hypothetical protein
MNILSLCRIFFLVTVAFIISCGSQRTFQANPPTQVLAGYVIIEIPDFKTSLGYVPPDAVWRIPNEIATRLEREKLFTGVSRAPITINERVVILEGDIVEFKPTTWYEQLVRTVKIVANVRFIDKAENRVIAEATFEGTSKAGAVSGGVPFAYFRLVDEIVQYIKMNYASVSLR